MYYVLSSANSSRAVAYQLVGTLPWFRSNFGHIFSREKKLDEYWYCCSGIPITRFEHGSLWLLSSCVHALHGIYYPTGRCSLSYFTWSLPAVRPAAWKHGRSSACVQLMIVLSLAKIRSSLDRQMVLKTANRSGRVSVENLANRLDSVTKNFAKRTLPVKSNDSEPEYMYLELCYSCLF